MSRLRSAALLGLAVAGIGVACRSATAPVAPAEALSPADRRQAALSSVYFLTAPDPFDEAALPPALRPMAIDDAVAALDPAATDEATLRRASCRLAADDVDGNEARLRRLGLSERELGEVQRAFGGASDAEYFGKYVTCRNVLDRLRDDVSGGCASRLVLIRPGVDPDTGADDVTITLDVHRPIEDIRTAIDPRHWVTCGSTYFDQSFYAKKENGVYPIDGQFNATPAAPQPSPGTNFEAVLFEDFVFRSNPSPAAASRFKNLLKIHAFFAEDPPSYEYEPERGVWCEVGMIEYPDSCIDVDSGEYTSAVGSSGRGAGWIRLTVRKAIRFKGHSYSFWLNQWAKVLLPLMAEDVRKAGCCHP